MMMMNSTLVKNSEPPKLDGIYHGIGTQGWDGLFEMADPFVSLKKEVEDSMKEISSAHNWTSR